MLQETQRTNLKKYLSPQELAYVVGVDITTVYGWTSDRQIPFIKIGRLVRFDPLKIEKWLKERVVSCVKDLA